METIIDITILILVIVMGVNTYIVGTNLNNSPGWKYLLIILCGAIIGCLAGYLRNNISSGLPIGILGALVFVFGGAISRWQRNQFIEFERKQNKQSKK